MLFGWTCADAPALSELLPPTLRKLTIRDNLRHTEDFEWGADQVGEAIQNFLPFAQSVAPMLNTIIVRAFDIGEDGDIDPDDSMGARLSYERLGLDIDISMIQYNLSPGLWTTHRELQEASWRDLSNLQIGTRKPVSEGYRRI